ncbi:MAG: LysM peptidoglycan-binding domain-containing protein [Anaerolineaceae bacterium]|nr:LysM peptidoglycan-binding domain-containing protein [Anaerolineaceae bacterium]
MLNIIRDSTKQHRGKKPFVKIFEPVSTGMLLCMLMAQLVSACSVAPVPINSADEATPQTVPTHTSAGPTPLPTRPPYQPGQLVDYIAQTGDTIPALAAHFNTKVDEIMASNPIIPANVTTLPPGMPMKIPIYYQPLWGTPFKIIPDSLFVNGPAQIGFNTVQFVDSQPGWLKNDHEAADGGILMSGGELVQHVADIYSISPRLILAILEYQTGALSQSTISDPGNPYLLGNIDTMHQGLYNQILWAVNTLNNGYYGWRTGDLTSFDHVDGTLERPDPWQNAASVALQYYFSQTMSDDDYSKATQSNGIAKTYQQLFGNPWANVQPHIPGSLQQPPLNFPFLPGQFWAFTGAPHTGWGSGDPLAAIDLAPPSEVTSCNPSPLWARAMADGVVARTDTGLVELDLDGDGDPRTGWVLFYLHIATDGSAKVGQRLKVGDPVGHPSCEGGEATGAHVHIARLYNGEWIPASGPLALNLEGWIAQSDGTAYQGNLVRYSQVVRACPCSDKPSQVQADLLNEVNKPDLAQLNDNSGN